MPRQVGLRIVVAAGVGSNRQARYLSALTGILPITAK
jgi:hypothetical protein